MSRNKKKKKKKPTKEKQKYTPTLLVNNCIKLYCAQLCPTLYGPMDYRLTGSSAYGIFQSRKLEWIAMPSSRRPSRSPTLAGGFFTTSATGEAPLSRLWGGRVSIVIFFFPTLNSEQGKPRLSNTNQNVKNWGKMIRELKQGALSQAGAAVQDTQEEHA